MEIVFHFDEFAKEKTKNAKNVFRFEAQRLSQISSGGTFLDREAFE